MKQVSQNYTQATKDRDPQDTRHTEGQPATPHLTILKSFQTTGQGT